jgi:hypothetical protein
MALFGMRVAVSPKPGAAMVPIERAAVMVQLPAGRRSAEEAAVFGARQVLRDVEDDKEWPGRWDGRREPLLLFSH